MTLAAKVARIAGSSSWREIQMCKSYWFTAAPVGVAMLAGTGEWTLLASRTDATKAVGASVQIDPMHMMENARNLPSAHYDDYSLVFN
jgi:hypothetical protein